MHIWWAAPELLAERRARLPTRPHPATLRCLHHPPAPHQMVHKAYIAQHPAGATLPSKGGGAEGGGRCVLLYWGGGRVGGVVGQQADTESGRVQLGLTTAACDVIIINRTADSYCCCFYLQDLGCCAQKCPGAYWHAAIVTSVQPTGRMTQTTHIISLLNSCFSVICVQDVQGPLDAAHITLSIDHMHCALSGSRNCIAH